MTNKQKHLIIAAAGTGGHVMPGLAVAKVMMDRGWTVSWIGTTSGMEAELVAKYNIDFYGLDFRGLRGRGLTGALKGGVKLLGASVKARSLLKQLGATAVFSTGGYVAVPVGMAAKSLGLPLVMMNCDAQLLLSTKVLLPMANALACGFDGPARAFAKDKGYTSGNPVREDIVALPAPQTRLAGRTGPLNVFIFGGSLGAQVLNTVLPQAFALAGKTHAFNIVHQTGKGRDEAVAQTYRELGVNATVVPFIDDMAARYNEADVVICRAGATSASELCAAGAASILVPFVAKTTAHQVGNARFMSRAGASVMVEQKDLTVQKAADILAGLDREQLMTMGINARRIAKPQAAKNVADLIEAVVDGRRPSSLSSQG